MKEKFTSLEWEELKLLPFLVFNLVAFADGKVDKKEAARFAEELTDAPRYRDPLHRELFMDIVTSDIGELQKQALDLPKMEERLTRAKSIVKGKLTDEEYHRFFGSLLISAGRIAKASGGGPLGLGDKVSDEEKRALVALTALFEVDLAVVARHFGER